MNTVSAVISDDTLNRIMTIESTGNPNIKARTSSAQGLFQFLSATWVETIERHRPDLLSQGAKLRTDPSFQIEMGAAFTEDNAAGLGAGYTDGDLYLAHFLGLGAARSVLRAPANDPVSRHVGRDAITANHSILAGKTCAQVRAWASKRMAQSGGHDWLARYWKGRHP